MPFHDLNNNNKYLYNMSSFEKQEKHHNKKKNLFNGGIYLLSPLNSKKINTSNAFSVNRKINDLQNKNDIKVIVNKLNPEKYRKKNNKNIGLINAILKVNKAYSLSRAKNSNKLNTNKIISTYSKIDYSNLTNNKYENNLTTDDLNKNNIDIINNGYNIKKLYINKKIKNINKFYKNDSFKISNNITNIQKYEHLKSDINRTPNIKLILPNRNIFEKNLENQNCDDIIGTPSGLFKKSGPSNLQFNSPGIFLKNYYNIPNIKIYKDDKIIIDSFTNQSTNITRNKNRKKSIDRNISEKEKDYLNSKNIKTKNKCPEDLHFYYIIMIQKGKKLEKEIEGE